LKQARHREPPQRKVAAKAPPRPAAGSASSPASEARRQAQSPAVGTGGGGGTNRDAQGRASASSYRSALASHLRRFKIYPPEARRKRIEGVALVAFSLDGGGRVTGVSLRRSSGAAILDTEALAMVRRASPFPAPPADLRDRFPTTVPIEFEIR
jgi:protein TonB